MSDLTVLFITANRMPARWINFHRVHLLAAIEDRPLITISVKPVDLPGTHLIQEGPFRAWSVYQNILRGAKLATTKYVAIAEDDTLYTRRHFSDFRPQDDEVAYDMSRWSVFSWKGKDAYFSAIRKHGNFTMIGPRELVVDALSERERKYPNGHDYTGEIGRREVEGVLGVTRRKLVEWWCIDPIVNLCHPEGLSPTYVNTKGRERKPGELKATHIPIWGSAAAIAEIYNEGVKEDARAQDSHSIQRVGASE